MFDSHPYYNYLFPCCGLPACYQSEEVKKRTYFRIYDNRIERNDPYHPFCWLNVICPCCPCCLREECVRDNISVEYFDKGVHRTYGRCCLCCGNTWTSMCGPPLLYNYDPNCAPIPCCPSLSCTCTPFYGERVSALQCCAEQKCLNNSCCENHNYCSSYLLGGVRDSKRLLNEWKRAIEDYKRKRAEKEKERESMAALEESKNEKEEENDAFLQVPGDEIVVFHSDNCTEAFGYDYIHAFEVLKA